MNEWNARLDIRRSVPSTRINSWPVARLPPARGNLYGARSGLAKRLAHFHFARLGCSPCCTFPRGVPLTLSTYLQWASPSKLKVERINSEYRFTKVALRKPRRGRTRSDDFRRNTNSPSRAPATVNDALPKHVATWLTNFRIDHRHVARMSTRKLNCRQWWDTSAFLEWSDSPVMNTKYNN